MPDRHRTRLRLPDYDYRSPGAYFLTICTHQRRHLFGEIQDGRVIPTEAGTAIEHIWGDLPNRFPGIHAGEFIVMPNHIHGILTLTDGSMQTPLSTVVGAYKSLTTHAYIVCVREHGWPSFSQRLWQPNFYEHVIRTEQARNRIIEYIRRNPAMWDHDPENS